MRSFEEWLRDTEIEPKYEERTPMEIAYKAGLREGIGDGSKVPCSDGLSNLVAGWESYLKQLRTTAETLSDGNEHDKIVAQRYIEKSETLQLCISQLNRQVG